MTRRVWFDAGGVYAIANLRGGGEYGEDWHKAGNLTHKQNVFDDFIACAEHLIKRKYTCPAKLAVMGGSNGGLLMGAFLTQRPELARAVVSRVGIYDMLRVELDPNGAFNITEFGSVKNPEQFKALYAYSPYHHVKNGTPYPAVLLTCGEHDGRVNPAQSRKMTAELQAATSSSHPDFTAHDRQRRSRNWFVSARPRCRTRGHLHVSVQRTWRGSIGVDIQVIEFEKLVSLRCSIGLMQPQTTSCQCLTRVGQTSRLSPSLSLTTICLTLLSQPVITTLARNLILNNALKIPGHGSAAR